MRCSWPTATVSELEADGILLVQDGNHGEYRPRREELVPEGTPHIRAADISDTGVIDFVGAQRINDVALARIRKGVGASGDVLLTHKGTVGRVARVPADAPHFVCSPQTTFWRSLRSGRLDQGFLFSYLRSPAFAAQLRVRMHESDMAPYVSLTAQRSFSVPLPPITEQRRIVSVLGALDDKIDSNRRLAKTLEDVAEVSLQRALSAPPLPWDRAWREATLGDVLSVLETGGRPRGGVKGITSGVPSIGAESIVGAGVFDFAKLKFIPRDYYDRLGRGRVRDRDVLLYKDGGRPGDFRPHVSMIGEGFPFREAAINEHVYRMRINPPYSQDFLYLWLRSDRLTEEMRQRGTGVAIPGLNSTAVKALPIVRPEPEVLEAAQAAIEPLLTTILRSAAESRILAEVRDALLPKLISGEIRVPDTADSDELIEPVAETLAVAAS